MLTLTLSLQTISRPSPAAQQEPKYTARLIDTVGRMSYKHAGNQRTRGQRDFYWRLVGFPNFTNRQREIFTRGQRGSQLGHWDLHS